MGRKPLILMNSGRFVQGLPSTEGRNKLPTYQLKTPAAEISQIIKLTYSIEDVSTSKCTASVLTDQPLEGQFRSH